MATWEEFGHILTLKNTSKIDRTKIETSRWCLSHLGKNCIKWLNSTCKPVLYVGGLLSNWQAQTFIRMEILFNKSIP
jgi:hypothetical protein